MIRSRGRRAKAAAVLIVTVGLLLGQPVVKDAFSQGSPGWGYGVRTFNSPLGPTDLPSSLQVMGKARDPTISGPI